MNQNRSSIWFRTLVYLGSAFLVFLIAIVGMLWFVGGERSAAKVLVADVKRLAALEEEWIRKAEDARKLGPAAMDVFIEERRESARARRALAARVESLEVKPKSGKNQQDIRKGLDNGYAMLRQMAPGPDPFGNELDRAKRNVIIAFLIAFAALAGIVVILFRMIVGPLETIVQNARRVSEGELDIKFHLQSDDELGQLSRVMDSLTTNFRELLTLMQSSCATGLNLTEELGPDEDARKSENRTETLKKLKEVFSKMREITEYFRQG